MATATTLMETADVYLGEFRQPAGDPDWAEQNQVTRPIVALPANAVWIVRGRRAEPQLVNPNHVVIHQNGDEYSRRPFLEAGYRCLFMYPSVPLLRRIAEEFDPAVADAGVFRLPVGLGSLDAVGYSLGRRLARYLRSGGRPDPLLARETLYRVLRRSVGATFGGRHVGGGPASKRRTARVHVRLVEEAKAALTASFDRRVTLDEVAGSIHVSPYHLARVFRARTGYGLHEYVQQLRVRAAFERLSEGERDVARIALELGFSSHSHLSASFRRSFGVTPSRARGVAGPPWAA